MRSKMTTAVLLSLLVAAGLATTDAYAQTSNTQRLMNIDETTGNIESTISGFDDMLSAIQDIMTDMSTTINSMMGTLVGVAVDVKDVNTKMDASMVSITSIEERLSAIEEDLVNVEGGGSSDELSAALALTNNRIAQISEQLNVIADSLKVARTDISELQDAPVVRPGTVLLEGNTDLSVDTFDYNRHGDGDTKKVPKYYELDMVFTCSTDVFLDTVTMDQSSDSSTRGYLDLDSDGTVPIMGTDGDDRIRNYIEVDGRDLFNSNLRVAAGNEAGSHVVFDRDVQFNNKHLAAGESLRFESRVYNVDVARDSGHALTTADIVIPLPRDVTNNVPLISNTTRDADGNLSGTNTNPFIIPHIELYELEVNWLSYESGTTCSISFGSSGQVAGLSHSATLVYGVTTDPDDAERTLRDFRDHIDCGGNPVEITEIGVATGDKWRLPGFADLVLTVNDDKEYELEFDTGNGDKPVLTNADEVLPIHLGNDDLTISGTIPVKNLLISLSYDTTPNTECEAEKGY